jgi:PTS system nitrogen regulatory IIA component
MKILDFVQPELVVPDLAGPDKKAVLEELANHLAAHAPGFAEGPSPSRPDMNRTTLLRVLIERERLASTAIGEGVAIPHGKLPVPKLVGCVGISRRGVDFESMDGRPTHIFFVLVAPENSTGIHLKALARISRLFKDPDFRSRLLQARDAADMFRVLADEDAKY